MEKKEERLSVYKKRKDELHSKCQVCKGAYPERCDSCIVGKRIRWLETEYSDVTGWSHDLWRTQ